jgi:hypothetical protein
MTKEQLTKLNNTEIIELINKTDKELKEAKEIIIEFKAKEKEIDVLKRNLEEREKAFNAKTAEFDKKKGAYENTTVVRDLIDHPNIKKLS